VANPPQAMRRVLMSTIAALIAVAPAAVAHASPPTSASVDAMYVPSGCSSTPCGSGDTPLPSGAIVGGPIEIHVSANGGLALLSRFRLEARPPDTKDFICIQQWFGNQRTNASEVYTWNTVNWPKPTKTWGCPEPDPHYHGEPASNGGYTFRVSAWNVNDDRATTSPGFALRLSNAPVAPAWSGQGPQAGTRSEGLYGVDVRWAPNRERDISEYHFVRVGPDGHASEFAVDAKKPGAQGCTLVPKFYYSCFDELAAGSPSGRYTYALVAVRPAPSGAVRCSLSGASCLESPLSGKRVVSVTVPAASASPSAPASQAAGARAIASGMPQGPVPAPSAVAPVEAARHESLLAGGSTPKTPLSATAAVLVAAVSAGFVAARRKVLRPRAPKDIA
jgi:hypothetical protein